nr:uncharacterized protein LOC109775160 [Aegilops tauschii subsp. strangulata]
MGSPPCPAPFLPHLPSLFSSLSVISLLPLSRHGQGFDAAAAVSASLHLQLVPKSRQRRLAKSSPSPPLGPKLRSVTGESLPRRPSSPSPRSACLQRSRGISATSSRCSFHLQRARCFLLARACPAPSSAAAIPCAPPVFPAWIRRPSSVLAEVTPSSPAFASPSFAAVSVGNEQRTRRPLPRASRCPRPASSRLGQRADSSQIRPTLASPPNRAEAHDFVPEL